jgi:hypothetical protein
MTLFTSFSFGCRGRLVWRALCGAQSAEAIGLALICKLMAVKSRIPAAFERRKE